jgi:hypothetical protein
MANISGQRGANSDDFTLKSNANGRSCSADPSEPKRLDYEVRNCPDKAERSIAAHEEPNRHEIDDC